MKNNKGFAPIFIVLIVGVVTILAGGVGYYLVKKEKVPIVQEQQLIGGDKDEYGCIGSAGYSWCEAKQKCLRIWEEECEKEIISTINSTTTLFRIDGWKLYSDNENYFELQYPDAFIEEKPELKGGVKRICFTNLFNGPSCPGMGSILEVVKDVNVNYPGLKINEEIPKTKNGLTVYNRPILGGGGIGEGPAYMVMLSNNIGLFYAIGGDCPPEAYINAKNLMHTIIPIK